MPVEIFNRHIGAAAEVLLKVPVKRGFVPYRSTMTYAARLRLFLRLVAALRVRGVEGVQRGEYVGPIDRLRTLHYVRWTLMDDDAHMLLAVNFDRPTEPYLRHIVEETGPLLDTTVLRPSAFKSAPDADSYVVKDWSGDGIDDLLALQGTEIRYYKGPHTAAVTYPARNRMPPSAIRSM